MAFSDYLELLPEDKREAFNAEVKAVEEKLSKAIIINTKDDAQKLIENNEQLKAINMAYLDKKNNERIERFEKEQLPKIIEEERAKGQKKDWEIEIEKLKEENEAAKNETKRERQKTRALEKATALGIPSSMVDRFIGMTDEETDEGLKLLSETLVPWRETAVKEALAQAGAQPKPKAGDDTPTDLKAQYDKASKEGNGVEMLRLKALMLQGK